MSVELSPLAVTGSTGFVGGHVARSLADSGVRQRLLVRTVAKAPKLDHSFVLPFSYSDRAASPAALNGVRTMFMVSASESADRLDQHRAFIDSAKVAGVEHIVYTSFVAAAPDAIFTLARDHYATEAYIRASGLDYTFLRDNFYQDAIVSFVGDDGVIRGPARDGRCAMVARVDVARMFSVARGTTIAFHNETIPEAYESRKIWNGLGGRTTPGFPHTPRSLRETWHR